jgi:hypothetical protein
MTLVIITILFPANISVNENIDGQIGKLFCIILYSSNIFILNLPCTSSKLHYYISVSFGFV